LQELRAELDRTRADTEAEIAAARERATAAEARARQRVAERTEASEAAEKAMQELRRELERVRADAESQVAAARGWAKGEAAAAQEAAQAEVARAYAAAEDAIRQAQAEAARTAALQPLMVPVPPFEFRAQTAHIENALNALQQIDYILEVGLAEDGDGDIPLDYDQMQTLVWVVREHAMYLCDESHTTTSDLGRHESTAAYENAARDTFRGFLQRIEAVTQQLTGRVVGPDAEILNAVNAMLADPWVKQVRRTDTAPQ
jgi:hypothetical protein